VLGGEVAYEPWELCNLGAQRRRAPGTRGQAQQHRRRRHKQQPRAGLHGGKDPWAKHGEASQIIAGHSLAKRN